MEGKITNIVDYFKALKERGKQLSYLPLSLASRAKAFPKTKVKSVFQVEVTAN